MSEEQRLKDKILQLQLALRISEFAGSIRLHPKAISSVAERAMVRFTLDDNLELPYPSELIQNWILFDLKPDAEYYFLREERPIRETAQERLDRANGVLRDARDD